MESLTKDIWVYIEVYKQNIQTVSLELLNQGRQVADAIKQSLTAVVIGGDESIKAAVKELTEYDVDRIIYVQESLLKEYSTDGYAKALEVLVQKYHPLALLIGGTTNGRDLAPRIACRLETGLTADATELKISDKGVIQWIKPAYGGNLMAVIECRKHRPQIGTIRENVFSLPEKVEDSLTETIREHVLLDAKEIRTVVGETLKLDVKNTVNLPEAEIVVAGGRGIGSAENFKRLEEWAKEIGGVLGATRAAVDAGWISEAYMIGQTGVNIGPKVYIACGISGAIQHVAGVKASDVIIAINKDASAPIFDIADYGVVGDIFEVLPELIQQMK